MSEQVGAAADRHRFAHDDAVRSRDNNAVWIQPIRRPCP
jgi:hypothetical protein